MNGQRDRPEPHDAALARLTASRARLSRLLLPTPQDDAAAASAGAASGWAAPRRWRAMWRLWARHNPLAPVFELAEQALAGWWHQHPLRATAAMLGEASAAGLNPLIRRHPFVAIGLGAAAGAGLAWSQPWRWRALRVYALRSVRQTTAWAAVQLSQPAIQLLLAGLLVDKTQAAAAPSTEPSPSP